LGKNSLFQSKSSEMDFLEAEIAGNFLKTSASMDFLLPLSIFPMHLKPMHTNFDRICQREGKHSISVGETFIRHSLFTGLEVKIQF
jgi:hypothetical protein